MSNPIREIIKKEVVEHAIPDYWLKGVIFCTSMELDDSQIREWPYADAGITGRKIVVDTYGGMARHGGGVFWQGPNKGDRSATYYTRWAAKHVVAAGLAQLVVKSKLPMLLDFPPVSLRVETFGAGVISEEELTERYLGYSIFDRLQSLAI